MRLIEYYKFLNKNLIFFLPLFFSIFSGCNTRNGSPSNNVYNQSVRLHPEFQVHIPVPDSVIIWFTIPEEDVLFNRADRMDEFKSNLKIHYRLRNESNVKTLADSNTLYFKHIKGEGINGSLTEKIVTVSKDTGVFNLYIVLRDQNRGMETSASFRIEKTKHSPLRLLPVFESTAQPVFGSPAGRRIIVKGVSESKKCFITYFRPSYQFPSPPFNEGTTGKSTLVAIGNHVYTEPFEMRDSVIALFRTDTTLTKGRMVSHFSYGAPYIKHATQLIPPLRYLCSREEYAALQSATDPKKAVDDFWLKRTTSPDRAREVLQAYYNRAEQANKYFSTHKEGYLTDRGMIHLIFGFPDHIRNQNNQQYWTYGEDRSSNTIVFTFEKTELPFGLHDYILDRGPFYKPIWYLAVDVWRSGQIYNL